MLVFLKLYVFQLCILCNFFPLTTATFTVLVPSDVSNYENFTAIANTAFLDNNIYRSTKTTSTTVTSSSDQHIVSEYNDSFLKSSIPVSATILNHASDAKTAASEAAASFVEVVSSNTGTNVKTSSMISDAVGKIKNSMGRLKLNSQWSSHSAVSSTSDYSNSPTSPGSEQNIQDSTPQPLPVNSSGPIHYTLNVTPFDLKKEKSSGSQRLSSSSIPNSSYPQESDNLDNKVITVSFHPGHSITLSRKVWDNCQESLLEDLNNRVEYAFRGCKGVRNGTISPGRFEFVGGIENEINGLCGNCRRQGSFRSSSRGSSPRVSVDGLGRTNSGCSNNSTVSDRAPNCRCMEVLRNCLVAGGCLDCKRTENQNVIGNYPKPIKRSSSGGSMGRKYTSPRSSSSSPPVQRQNSLKIQSLSSSPPVQRQNSLKIQSINSSSSFLTTNCNCFSGMSSSCCNPFRTGIPPRARQPNEKNISTKSTSVAKKNSSVSEKLNISSSSGLGAKPNSRNSSCSRDSLSPGLVIDKTAKPTVIDTSSSSNSSNTPHSFNSTYLGETILSKDREVTGSTSTTKELKETNRMFVSEKPKIGYKSRAMDQCFKGSSPRESISSKGSSEIPESRRGSEPPEFSRDTVKCIVNAVNEPNNVTVMNEPNPVLLASSLGKTPLVSGKNWSSQKLEKRLTTIVVGHTIKTLEERLGLSGPMNKNYTIESTTSNDGSVSSSVLTGDTDCDDTLISRKQPIERIHKHSNGKKESWKSEISGIVTDSVKNQIKEYICTGGTTISNFTDGVTLDSAGSSRENSRRNSIESIVSDISSKTTKSSKDSKGVVSTGNQFLTNEISEPLPEILLQNLYQVANQKYLSYVLKQLQSARKTVLAIKNHVKLLEFINFTGLEKNSNYGIAEYLSTSRGSRIRSSSNSGDRSGRLSSSLIFDFPSTDLEFAFSHIDGEIFTTVAIPKRIQKIIAGKKKWNPKKISNYPGLDSDSRSSFASTSSESGSSSGSSSSDSDTDSSPDSLDENLQALPMAKQHNYLDPLFYEGGDLRTIQGVLLFISRELIMGLVIQKWQYEIKKLIVKREFIIATNKYKGNYKNDTNLEKEQECLNRLKDKIYKKWSSGGKRSVDCIKSNRTIGFSGKLRRKSLSVGEKLENRMLGLKFSKIENNLDSACEIENKIVNEYLCKHSLENLAKTISSIWEKALKSGANSGEIQKRISIGHGDRVQKKISKNSSTTPTNNSVKSITPEIQIKSDPLSSPFLQRCDSKLSQLSHASSLPNSQLSIDDSVARSATTMDTPSMIPTHSCTTPIGMSSTSTTDFFISPDTSSKTDTTSKIRIKDLEKQLQHLSLEDSKTGTDDNVLTERMSAGAISSEVRNSYSTLPGGSRSGTPNYNVSPALSASTDEIISPSLELSPLSQPISRTASARNQRLDQIGGSSSSSGSYVSSSSPNYHSSPSPISDLPVVVSDLPQLSMYPANTDVAILSEDGLILKNTTVISPTKSTSSRNSKKSAKPKSWPKDKSESRESSASFSSSTSSNSNSSSSNSSSSLSSEDIEKYMPTLAPQVFRDNYLKMSNSYSNTLEPKKQSLQLYTKYTNTSNPITERAIINRGIFSSISNKLPLSVGNGLKITSRLSSVMGTGSRYNNAGTASSGVGTGTTTTRRRTVSTIDEETSNSTASEKERSCIKDERVNSTVLDLVDSSNKTATKELTKNKKNNYSAASTITGKSNTMLATLESPKFQLSVNMRKNLMNLARPLLNPTSEEGPNGLKEVVQLLNKIEQIGQQFVILGEALGEIGLVEDD